MADHASEGPRFPRPRQRRQLHLVNPETGELLANDDAVLIEQLQSELKGKSLQIGKLKKELRHLRSVEPESAAIREVLDYWRHRCKPKAEIAPAGKRWEKVRARLADRLDDRPPWTVAELKLAVDGALLDPWLSGRDRGSKGYLDAETIFRDSEMVERLMDVAIGFKAEAGVGVSDLIDLSDELRMVNWKFLLRACECTHKRVEHAKADPEKEGRERCLMLGCPCEDFDSWVQVMEEWS